MERRTLLGAVGGAALSALAAVDLFAPGLIVGSPQAEGDPVSTERTVTDEDIEYQPDSDTVHWPALMSGDGTVAEYETEPFADWASREAAVAAHDAVESVLPERLDGDPEGVGVSVSGEYLGLAVTVSTVIPRGDGGELQAAPRIARSTLVDAAPRTVEATIRLGDGEHTRDVPVFVEERPEAVPL